nr:uncharacterized protein CFP56_62141 [Quercus suber]
METPYTIASLPKPLDTEYGRAYAAPVYGLRGSRKRKRHEVAVGIDGESVNIYNVQSQANVASHALPPQSYLCCAPCSIYRRFSQSTSSQRRTYLVTRDGREDTKRRLVCFIAEDSRGSGSLLEQNLAPPTKKECKLRSEDIVEVDVLPSSIPETEGDLSIIVIVTYRSGCVDCFSGDLADLLWRHNAQPAGNTDERASEVEYALALDLSTAKKGLLAGRGDVVAALESADLGASNTTPPLLCHCTCDLNSRRISLYAIRRKRQADRDSVVEPVMDVQIPTRGAFSPNRASYELHAASGKLYQLSGGSLTILNLSGTVPRVEKTFGNRAEPVLDFVRLSSTSILITAPGRISLYETKYGSIQASMALALPTSAESAAKKRKRIETENVWSSMRSFVSFLDLNTVVGLSATDLVAFQAGEGHHGSKRGKADGAMLIDVLGKGNHASAASNLTTDAKVQDKQEDGWIQWKAEADDIVARNDDSEFEQLAAQTLKLESSPISPDVRQLLIEAGDSVQGPADIEDMSAVDTFDLHNIDRRRALYLLGNCFRIATEEERAASWHGSLFIHTVASANTLRYFALTGFLCADSIAQALGLDSDHKAHTKIGRGDVMDAVGRFDTDFQLMHSLLATPVHWELAEVVQAVKVLSESFESILGSRSQTLKALTLTPQTNGDIHMSNGETDTNLEYELRAAEFALDHAFTELDSSPEGMREILYEIFRRLNTFPMKMIVTYFREMLSHQHLIRLISALRLELALGGWISRYIDYQDDQEHEFSLEPLKAITNPPTEDTFSTPSDSAVSVVALLLSAAIDAIGTSGWLVAGIDGSASKTQDMVNALRAEVSAGVEGCYEAQSLELYMREIDRHATLLKDKENERELEAQLHKNVVSADLDVEMGIRAVEEVMMPMGLPPGAAAGAKGKGLDHFHLVTFRSPKWITHSDFTSDVVHVHDLRQYSHATPAYDDRRDLTGAARNIILIGTTRRSHAYSSPSVVQYIPKTRPRALRATNNFVSSRGSILKSLGQAEVCDSYQPDWGDVKHCTDRRSVDLGWTEATNFAVVVPHIQLQRGGGDEEDDATKRAIGNSLSLARTECGQLRCERCKRDWRAHRCSSPQSHRYRAEQQNTNAVDAVIPWRSTGVRSSISKVLSYRIAKMTFVGSGGHIWPRGGPMLSCPLGPGPSRARLQCIRQSAVTPQVGTERWVGSTWLTEEPGNNDVAKLAKQYDSSGISRSGGLASTPNERQLLIARHPAQQHR